MRYRKISQSKTQTLPQREKQSIISEDIILRECASAGGIMCKAHDIMYASRKPSDAESGIWFSAAIMSKPSA